MDASTIPAYERGLLLEIFRRFRAHDTGETAVDYQNRNLLEQKLWYGSGDLTSTDVFLLHTAAAHESSLDYEEVKRLIGDW